MSGVTAEQIVAAAFTAIREPEYHISEQEDRDDAEIAVDALRRAGMLPMDVMPDAEFDVETLSKEGWLGSFDALLKRAGVDQGARYQVMLEARMVFAKAERIAAAQELDTMARMLALDTQALAIEPKLSGILTNPIVKRADELRSRGGSLGIDKNGDPIS